MRARKTVQSFLAVMLAAGGFASLAAAEEANQNPAASPSLIVTDVKKEEIPKLPPVMRAYATVGTNKCAFLVPRGFRLETRDDGTVAVVAMDHSCFMTMRFAGKLTAETKTLKPAVARAWVLDQYSGAEIVSEFSRSVAGHNGPGFDLRVSVVGGALQSVRVAYIPCVFGILEFKLVAAPEKFRKATYKLNNLLLSFRTNERGKLQVIPLSGKF